MHLDRNKLHVTKTNVFIRLYKYIVVKNCLHFNIEEQTGRKVDFF